MHPYKDLPDHHYWRKAISQSDWRNGGFDCGRKFQFTEDDKFAIIGSCFAQYLNHHLVARGCNVVVTEQAHPLHRRVAAESYNKFSARYGNVYTNRQLLELLQQALGKRPMIREFCLRDDGRYGDMLRPLATPEGFTSIKEAERDREYHLACVQKMVEQSTVFIFTMGLTEAWTNRQHGYTYPICPGTSLGQFEPTVHQFHNFTFDECLSDLREVCELLKQANPKMKVVFTVSPVSLVATMEDRNIAVSTMASKSKLRTVADTIIQQFSFVDYFPSYEIICGPQSQGMYWNENLREVNKLGVDTVMSIFFQSRFSATADNLPHENQPLPHRTTIAQEEIEMQNLVNAECDEKILDPGLN